MDCHDGQIYNSTDQVSYRQYCNVDWVRDGKNVNDIAKKIVYTFQACMDACAEYNK